MQPLEPVSGSDLQTFLSALAGDAVYKIQLAVAKNPETPADVLAVLAEHQDKAIQATVAEHRNATEEIIASIRLECYAVADNSGTPSELRQQLAQDSNRIVRAAARV